MQCISRPVLSLAQVKIIAHQLVCRDPEQGRQFEDQVGGGAFPAGLDLLEVRVVYIKQCGGFAQGHTALPAQLAYFFA